MCLLFCINFCVTSLFPVDCSVQPEDESQCKGQQKIIDGNRSRFCLFLLYKPCIVQRGLNLYSQFSSIYISFICKKKSKSTLQMRRWWKDVSLPAYPPLALYFFLCPLTCLHCIKHNWFPLSSLTLLVISQRQGHGRPSRQGWVFFCAGTGWPLTPGGELITGNDALNSLHHVHLTACISVLCKSSLKTHITSTVFSHCLPL